MERTLYVSDLDGTLLNDDEIVSNTSVEIISSLIDRGILFTYATARAYSSAKKATEPLCFQLPVATYNGAIIVDPVSGDILEYSTINKSSIFQQIDQLLEFSICPLVYSLNNGKESVSWKKTQGNECNGIIDFIGSRNSDIIFHQSYSATELLSGELFYIATVGNLETVNKCKSIFEHISDLSYCVQEDAYKNGLFWFEAFSVDATKDKSIKKLKRYAKADRVISFGDNINDIAMLQASDYSIAVGNAFPELIKIADFVTGTNKQDGVAQWLLKNANVPKIYKS